MARILFIISQKNFRDEELSVPLDMVRTAGHIHSIASPKKGKCIGMLGLEVNSDISIDEVDTKKYDAFIFIGGSGSVELAGNQMVLSIAREASSQGKLIAAICMAPIILAKAGILSGRKATVFMTHDSISALKQGNAIFLAQSVVVDKNIITAEGPKAAKEFAKKINELLL